MTDKVEDYDRHMESVKTSPFDPNTQVFDEWFYSSFYNLIGAKNTRVFYLLKTKKGLPENAPKVADPAKPTPDEQKAIN